MTRLPRTYILAVAVALLCLLALCAAPRLAGASPPQARCKPGALLRTPPAQCRAGKWVAITVKDYERLLAAQGRMGR
jgi:hypothetical protein